MANEDISSRPTPKDWISEMANASTKDLSSLELKVRRTLPRKLSVVGEWQMLPEVCHGALSFYTAEKFYFNKWLQSDFLSILLVHGSKGDTDETIMIKAFIVTSTELAQEMQEVKARAAKVIVESIRDFLQKRKERRRREREKRAAVESAIRKLPVKEWRAIHMPDKNLQVTRTSSLKEMFRTGAIKVIVAGNFAHLSMQKYRASTIVDAAAAGNAKLLEELLASRRAMLLEQNRRSPMGLMKSPSRQALGTIARLKSAGSSQDLESPNSPQAGNAFKKGLNALAMEDLNAADITRKTPLQAALESKSAECMLMLLNEPEIDVCIQDVQQENTIVHALICTNGMDKVFELLKLLLNPKFHFDINTTNRNGSTVLMLAAGRGNLVGEDAHSVTPLKKDAPAPTFQASSRRLSKFQDTGLDVLKYLLSHKADANITDNNGRYAIEYAAEVGNFEAVVLLAEQSDVRIESINRALFSAIPRESKANLEIIRYLICEKHAEIEQSCGKKDNILLVAARHNQYDCVQALLTWPFIPPSLRKARNADFYSALHAAVHESNNKIALLLIKSVSGNSIFAEQNDNLSKPRSPKPDSDHESGVGDRSNAKYRQGRRRAVLASKDMQNHDVVDEFLFSIAAQVKNVDIIEHLLFEASGFKDSTIQVSDRSTGMISTNLICWSVRQRNLKLLNLLLKFGVDVNATEQHSGLFPLIIAVMNLAAPPWSHLAMSVLELGKDFPCIALQDIVNILKMSKYEICHIADMLQDSKGNPLKSPTGRQLFSRNSWKFSWYGFQAVCAETSAELKSKVEAYAKELDISLQIYEIIIDHPSVNIQQVVSKQTVSALAVECGNWKVFEDLRSRGASICHPSVIQAASVNKRMQLLIECLYHETIELTLTEEALRHIFDKTCEAGHVECAQLLFEHGKQRNLYLSVQDQILKAAINKQHWVIDFLLSKDRSYQTKGKALLICAENGDYRSLAKLLAHGADPDFRQDDHSTDLQDDEKSWKGMSPIAIAGKYWGRSGSQDHYEVICQLLQANLDVAQQDDHGKTILMWAAMRGHCLICDAVLSAICKCKDDNDQSPQVRAFINLQDSDGKTALMYAVLSLSSECVELLLQWNANVDIISHGSDEGDVPLTALGYLTSRCCENAPNYLLTLVSKSKTLKHVDENQRTFMVWAARFGHNKAVHIAMQRSTPEELGIHEIVEGSYSPLEMACMCNRKEICKMIVQTWDCDIPVPDSERIGDFVGVSLFERFIEYDWQDVTETLIQNICPLDAKCQIVVDALQSCVEKGWLNCVESLLKRGVSPNSFSSSGHPPLLVAARLNQIDTVKCLLKNSATGLEAAAIIAIYLNHLDCFQVLFGAVEQSPEFIRSAACIAALQNNVKALKQILAEQAANREIHVLGPKLSTMLNKWIPLRNLNRLEPALYQAVVSDNLAVPLLCAVAKGSLSCTTFLLEKGADPFALDENGLSPMIWACAVGNIEIVKVLLKHGACIPDDDIMPFAEMMVLYNITVIEKIEGRMKKLLRRTLQTDTSTDKIRISVQPLLVALLKGHTDVVRLLLEVGANTEKVLDWCNKTLKQEPKMEPFLRSMLELLVLYEDYKAYGPFGIAGHEITHADVGRIPDDGNLHAVVAQFSPSDWSLIALQFVHRVKNKLLPCAIHSTTKPLAGQFHKLHQYAHIERLDLEEHEFIVQVEIAITDTHIKGLRFSTNLRVTQWLGGEPLLPDLRLVTVNPVGREVVGLFSAAADRFYLMGFVTRLRSGDFPWRTYRKRYRKVKEV